MIAKARYILAGGAILVFSITAGVFSDVCGDPGTEILGDLSGPNGTRDCYVNLFDFGVIAHNWLTEAEPPSDSSICAFFAAAPDTGSSYDPNKLYPNGRKMIMTLYSVQNTGDLANLKNDGFTAVGPYYGGQEYARWAAGISGLPTFYGIGYPGGMPNPVPPNSVIQALVTSQINAVAADANIAAWYIFPEELRYWYPDEIRLLSQIYQTAHLVDPCNRPAWMYSPQHYPAYGLEPTLPYQDFCAKGMYVNYSGYKYSRVWLRWCVEQETEAIENKQSSAVPMVMPEMIQDPAPSEYGLIPLWTRHDTYLGLVTGAKGVIIYSGFRRAGLTQWQTYYDGYAGVADELNGEKNLSQVFLFGQPRTDLGYSVTSGPNTVSCTVFGGVTYTRDSVSLYDAAYGTNIIGSDRYLFLVNSANSSVTVTISGLPLGTILRQSVFDDGDLEEISGGSFDLELPSLEVKCFRFTPLPCTPVMGDFTGPDGEPDCLVDFWDVEVLAEQWLKCSNPQDPACD